MGAIKQIGQLIITVIVISGVVIALAVMFPNGELGAGAANLAEGLQRLFTAVGNAVSSAV